MSTATTPTSTTTARRTAYTGQIVGLMLVAYVLSVVHTVVSHLSGIAPDGTHLTDPAVPAFYALGFGAALLARREGVVAQTVVIGWLVVQMLIGIFVYPDSFGPEQQTTFGWFENDVFMGLLTAALYLAVQRRRRVVLA